LLTLTDILEALTGKKLQLPALYLSEAAIDSRQVIPGALFIALKGERTDGHLFVAEAFKKGASLALVQDIPPGVMNILDLRGDIPADFQIPQPPFCLLVPDSLKALQQIARFWRRKLNIKVIGITGSVGKSTTKELVAEVLCQRYRTLRSPGNLNNEIGLPLTILQLGYGYERAVLEMGFYVPGEISFLCDIALPDIGLVTNIGTVHAERAGSQEAIARGKAELIQALPPAPQGTAILNLDDPWVSQMASLTRAEVFFYGLDPSAHLWADQVVSAGLEGIRFRLHYKSEELTINVPLIGRHSVHTALRATAAGLVEGLSWGEIINGLHQGNNQLRLVAVRTPSGAMILDDTYNASPESTLAALNLLQGMKGRRIAVLGDMLELGIYEREGHEMVGLRAAEVVDWLVAVGERAKIIAESAQSAGLKPSQISWVKDVAQATQVLKDQLKDGDVVLVKGSHGLRMDRMIAELEVAS